LKLSVCKCSVIFLFHLKLPAVFIYFEDSQLLLPRKSKIQKTNFYFQAYFKGDLGVSPDTGKSTVFKEMILGGIRYFCNLIRSAAIPQTFKKGSEASEYGDWSIVAGGDVSAFKNLF
jgi:hypothetical protein